MPYIALDPATATAVVTGLGAPLVNTGETLLSYRTELALALGGRSDLDAARSDKYTNFAYLDLCTSLQLEELASASLSFNTVVDQPLYLLPDVVRSTRSIALVDTATYPVAGGIDLVKKDLDWYRKQIVAAETTGPLYFFKTGKLLVLYPTPKTAKAISVDFRLRPVLLTADNHSPILPLEWHEGMLLLAKAKLASALLDTQLAAVFENDWIRFVRRKTDLEAAEQENLLAIARPVQKASHLRRPTSRKLELDQY